MRAKSSSRATRETSLASVLRDPEVDVTRLVGLSDPLLVDPSWQEMLDDARAEGRREGFDEGRLAARAEIVAEAASAAESIGRAVDGVFSEMHRLREEMVASLVQTALDLVEKVVGDLPAEPEGLVDRIRRALDELDSERLEVRVAPGMVEYVTAGLADEPQVSVMADPSLGAGESRIVGDWCDADLTRQTALLILREVLGA